MLFKKLRQRKSEKIQKIVDEEFKNKMEKYLADIEEKTGLKYVSVTPENSEAQIIIPQTEKDRIDDLIREREGKI